MISQKVKGISLLVVDDDPAVRAGISLFFQHAGYGVVTARDAEAALLCLQNRPFDVLLLDLKMPGMGGLELITRIRQSHPTLPVIVLTGHATLESAIEAVRLGVRDYVTKPVDLEEVLARIEQILAEQGVEDQQRVIMTDLKTLVRRWDSLDAGDAPGPTGTAESGPAHILERGPFRIDLHARRVTLDGRPVHLSPTSFDYLVTLARHAPDPVPPEILLQESQGYREGYVKAREIVRWRIHQLRRSLEPNQSQPCYIITVHGRGYGLVA